MSTRYFIRMVDAAGQLYDGPYDFTEMTYSKAINTPGALTLKFLTTKEEDRGAAFPEDARMLIMRAPQDKTAYLEFDAIWFVTRNVTTIGPDQKRLVEIGAKSALDLAGRRLVAYTAGSAQASIAGPADNMMKRIVNENLGSSAGAGGRNVGVYTTLNVGLGPTVNKQIGWRGLLQTLQEIARDAENAGTAVYYDICWAGTGTNTGSATGGMLEFRTWIGQPGAAKVEPILSLENGTLRAASWGFDRDGQTNILYGLGQEYQGARQVVTAVHPSYAYTPFSRREGSIEARNATTTAELTAEANAEMARIRPKDVVVADVANSALALYGVHWYYGDRIPISVAGRTYTGLVEAVQVSVSQNTEQVKATLKF